MRILAFYNRSVASISTISRMIHFWSLYSKEKTPREKSKPFFLENGLLHVQNTWLQQRSRWASEQFSFISTIGRRLRRWHCLLLQLPLARWLLRRLGISWLPVLNQTLAAESGVPRNRLEPGGSHDEPCRRKSQFSPSHSFVEWVWYLETTVVCATQRFSTWQLPPNRLQRLQLQLPQRWKPNQKTHSKEDWLGSFHQKCMLFVTTTSHTSWIMKFVYLTKHMSCNTIRLFWKNWVHMAKSSATTPAEYLFGGILWDVSDERHEIQASVFV